MRSRLSKTAAARKNSSTHSAPFWPRGTATSDALRPARKIGEYIRHGICDQLDKPNHRDSEIVLPNEVNHASEHDQDGPKKPVESDSSNQGAENLPAQG